jgi:hypothetical protein
LFHDCRFRYLVPVVGSPRLRIAEQEQGEVCLKPGRLPSGPVRSCQPDRKYKDWKKAANVQTLALNGPLGSYARRIQREPIRRIYVWKCDVSEVHDKTCVLASRLPFQVRCWNPRRNFMTDDQADEHAISEAFQQDTEDKLNTIVANRKRDREEAKRKTDNRAMYAHWGGIFDRKEREEPAVFAVQETARA